ncbi:hypothetical protein AAVH_38453 [Aphelenchoides avenae]|nr:hypothetical protein AAVH_38453 [Aphelenchus avenae]
MRLLSLVLLTVILLSVPCEAAPRSNGILKGVPSVSSSSATASLPTVTALPSSNGNRMHSLPSSFSPLPPTTEPSVPGSEGQSWTQQVIRILLFVGMGVMLGAYVFIEKSPYFVILFLFFVCLLIFISPAKETEGERKYGWAALTFSGLLLVGMASSLGCYICSVNTPYFILLFMLLLDILLLIWKPITLF